jgi:hypothetical protein
MARTRNSRTVRGSGNLCREIDPGAVLEPDAKSLIRIVFETGDLAVHIRNGNDSGYESLT